jgi:hypothetical protein
VTVKALRKSVIKEKNVSGTEKGATLPPKKSTEKEKEIKEKEPKRR